MVEAAIREFSLHGFEATSMDAIAVAANTTKMTIYAYFPGKEDLFLSALQALADAVPVPDWSAARGGDLRSRLGAMALELLERATCTQMERLVRLLSLSSGPAVRIASQLWRSRLQPYETAVADMLAQEVRAGGLRIPDIDCAAAQFTAMVIGRPVIRMLVAHRKEDGAACRQAALAAVDLFVRAYGRPEA